MILRILLLPLLLAVSISPVLGQTELQQSHIEGNIPSQEEFSKLLERDLLAFFKSSKASRVEYQLLRDAPTQSGLSFPKYYAWVKVFSGTVLSFQGAVRLAAINRARFEITDTLSVQQIRTAPNEVDSIFPSLLVPSIIERAADR
jgi:hypothetical protein